VIITQYDRRQCETCQEKRGGINICIEYHADSEYICWRCFLEKVKGSDYKEHVEE